MRNVRSMAAYQHVKQDECWGRQLGKERGGLDIVLMRALTSSSQCWFEAMFALDYCRADACDM